MRIRNIENRGDKNEQTEVVASSKYQVPITRFLSRLGNNISIYTVEAFPPSLRRICERLSSKERFQEGEIFPSLRRETFYKTYAMLQKHFPLYSAFRQFLSTPFLRHT